MGSVRKGTIMLPRFQRYEAWSPQNVSIMLTSVIRDLPVGSALVLGVKGDLPFESRAIETAPEAALTVTELLLDGQQRLTALWRALHDTYDDCTYLVDLAPDNGDAPEVVAQTRWTRNGKRYPLWADNPRACWERQLIPFSLLDPDEEERFYNWSQEAGQGDPATAQEIQKVVVRMRSGVAAYNLPFLHLEPDTPKDVAVDVFIKLNTTFVRLSPFDIVVAQVEAALDEPLHALVDGLTGKVPRLRDYASPEDVVLSAAALLQERPPNQRSYLSMDLNRLVEDWDAIVGGCAQAIAFLEEERVLHQWLLPSDAVLAPLVALWARAPREPDALGNLRTVMRRYVWLAFCTDRYDRSVPTFVLQDYRALASSIAGDGPFDAAPIFDAATHPLPEIEMLRRARWPRYKDRLARAILLLSMRRGARDIADGSEATITSVPGREFHHLFPVAYLTGSGEPLDPDRALNCILITWRTNRKLAAKSPLQYLLERAEASRLGEQEIRERLATHLVDYDLLVGSDYGAFLESRAGAVRSALDALCHGRHWPA